MDDVLPDEITHADSLSYDPRHTTPGCKCSMLSIDEDLLCQAAESHETVLVTLQDEQEPYLKCTRTDLSHHPLSSVYTAISHVRKEGLANSKASSLPLCQVRRLQSFVNDVQHTSSEASLFWIDALCLPLHESSRKLALENVHLIFSEAQETLVLIPAIEQHDMNEPGTIIMAINQSSWMSRVWTLQETMLAKKLYFRVPGSFFNLDEELEISSGVSKDPPLSWLTTEIIWLKSAVQKIELSKIQDLGTVEGIKTRLLRALRFCYLIMSPRLRALASEGEQSVGLRLISEAERACLSLIINDDLDSSIETAPRRLRTVWEILDAAGVDDSTQGLSSP